MKKTRLLTFILISAIVLQLLVYTDLAAVNARPSHSFPHIDHLTITPKTSSVMAGQWQTFSLTAYDKCGNSWDLSDCPYVIWSINSGEGTYVWNSNSVKVFKVGTWTVTASYGCKSDSASLTVTPTTNQSDVVSLSISPASSTISAGSSQSYIATATDSYDNTWDVTDKISAWSITLDAGGYWNGATYISEKAGVWTVTATYQDKTATATLNVTPATSPEFLASITASVNPASIAAPGTATGTATAFDSLGNSWDISTIADWSILGGGDGGSWAQNVYTSRVAGVYTVQASYGGKTATAALTVTHATDLTYLDHIIISPKESTVNAGVSQSYTATAYDTFGNSWSVSAVYSCVNSNVAISGNTVYSNSSGTYTIIGAYGGRSDSATLVVVGHLPATSLAVAPKTASIAAGSSVSFTATASDGYNTWDATSSVTWAIDSAAGGSWSQSLGQYTSEKAGHWTIKATLDSLSDTATLTVTANPALLAYITINPKTIAVTAGLSQSYTVTAFDQLGNSLGDVTESTSFAVPGASVAGNSVTANNVGDYIVTATYKGLTDTANLTVNGYIVRFTANGLPSGTTWSIRFGGQLYFSSTNTITISNVSARTYSWSTQAYINAGQTRYLTAQTAGSISIPNEFSQKIDYSKQFLVTYSASGNATSIPLPSAEWVDLGKQALGIFIDQVTNEVQDTRYSFVGDDRPQTITHPTLITGSYVTQYKVTFQQDGVLSDAQGTILTVADTPIGYSKLPHTLWVENGTQLAFIFEPLISNLLADKVYTLMDVNATSPIVIDEPTLIEASYGAQETTSLSILLVFVVVSFVIALSVILLLGYRGQRMKKEQALDASVSKM